MHVSHLGTFYNTEGVEVAVREWLRMGDSDLTRANMGKMHQRAWEFGHVG
jgi:hypothetical protein